MLYQKVSQASNHKPSELFFPKNNSQSNESQTKILNTLQMAIYLHKLLILEVKIDTANGKNQCAEVSRHFQSPWLRMGFLDKGKVFISIKP